MEPEVFSLVRATDSDRRQPISTVCRTGIQPTDPFGSHKSQGLGAGLAFQTCAYAVNPVIRAIINLEDFLV